MTSDGSLLVGTGDAAEGTNPENLDSLGGKTLRLDRFTGGAVAEQPVRRASGPRRYVHTYGHRNVQGVAERADGTLWNIEQGTYRDDEVNLLVNGGDYGYNPVPGYNESVPMTDQSLPGKQIKAKLALRQPDAGDERRLLRERRQVGCPERHAGRGLPQGEPGPVPHLQREGSCCACGSHGSFVSTAGSGRSPVRRTATC